MSNNKEEIIEVDQKKEEDEKEEKKEKEEGNEIKDEKDKEEGEKKVEKDDKGEEEIKEEDEEKNETDNEMKRRLRKNPKKTILFYSTQVLDKYKKKENETDLNEEELKLMRIIIEKLKSNQRSYYFKTSAIRMIENKIDKDAYRAIIAHPMDLSKIIRKLNKKKYNSFQELYDDIALIWDNAQKYNQKKSIIYEDAEFMRDFADKVFKEKELNNKVKFKERINNEINEDQGHVKEEININNDNNFNQDLEIDLSDEKYNEALIGKKRKNSKKKDKDKEKNKENGIHEVQDQDINEEDKTPIIDIKNSMDNKDSLDTKNSEISHPKKKTNKVTFISSIPNSKKNNGNNDNNSNNNNIDLIEKKDISKIKDFKNIKNNEDNTDLKKNNDSNNNLKPSENNINDPQENEENHNNIMQSNEYEVNCDKKGMDESIEKNNTLLQEEEKLKKKEEDETKNKWNEEKIKIYAHKIAKKLDKLNDEDMFCLVELIDQIQPEAIIEENNLVSIDMTKFLQNTYVQVYKLIENKISNYAIIK